MNTTDNVLASKTEAVAVESSPRSFWRIILVVFFSAYAGFAFYGAFEQLINLRPKSGCMFLVVGGLMLLATFYSWLRRWGRVALLVVLIFVIGDMLAVLLPAEKAAQQFGETR